MVLLPLLGAIAQAFLPSFPGEGKDRVSRWLAISASIASSFCGLVLVLSMASETAELQAAERFTWIGSYAITYEMGLDGLNVLLVLLVSIVFPVLIASEWNRAIGAKGMFSLFLLLQTSFAGAVCAQDLFLLFFFWALSSLPFYFLIGIWGGEERESAAFRTITTAAFGNALLFVSLILVYYSVEPHSFSIRDLAGTALNGKFISVFGSDVPISGLAFGLAGAGLALRAAVWPAHAWFTHAAREAPASVFVALSAVTIPVAIYIFMRLSYTLFPDTLLAAASGIVAIGALNLLIGGISAAAQGDLRMLGAYLCMGQAGLVLIGVGSLDSAGVVGAVYQNLALGLGLAGFGLFAGLMSERLGHSRFLESGGGGLALRGPMIALVAGIFVASLLALPGFGGFIGHALIVIGSYPAHPAAVLVALAALLLATYYLFIMYRLLFLGKQNGAGSFTDLSLRERAYLFPLVAGIVLCGMYPKPLLELVRPTVLTLLSAMK